MREYIDRQASVDAFDHAAVGVAEDGCNQVRRGAALAKPLRARASQVIRRARLKAGGVTRCDQIASRIAPATEQQLAGALGMLQRVNNQRALPRRDKWHHALACLSFRTAQEHAPCIDRNVRTSRTRDGAPFGRGADHERNSRRVIGSQQRKDQLQLVRREKARTWFVVRRELVRHQRVNVAAPKPSALRDLQRGAQRHQLFVDRVVGRALATALRNVVVDQARLQLTQWKRHVLFVRVQLKHALQVPGLHSVELHRFVATAARLRALCAFFEQARQRVIQRRVAKTCVVGIGGVAFPLHGDGVRSLLVRATRAALNAHAVLVVVRVPSRATAIELHRITVAFQSVRHDTGTLPQAFSFNDGASVGG